MSEENFNILSIETCTAAGSVAVVRSSDLKVLSLNEWTRGRSHAEVMTPAMDDAVSVVGGFKEIHAIAVGIGPGSFTGIRVGLNAARTAAWNLKLPLVPIRTTDALLEGAISSGAGERSQYSFGAVINAQMGMIFTAIATTGVTSGAVNAASKKPGVLGYSLPVAMTPDDFANLFQSSSETNLFLVGDGVDLVREFFDSKNIRFRRLDRSLDFPHAATVGRMAARKLVGQTSEALVRNFTWQQAQPLYIRGSGAEEKKG
jgi:tRNA threonylcarbamoyl adenosine modification protein YeaZ